MARLNRRQAIFLGASIGVAGAASYLASKLIGPGSALVPGRSRAKPFEGDAELPKQADVVIIGGGDIGTAAAYYLAKSGLSVALCEKGLIGGEGSSRSVGHVLCLGESGDKLQFIAQSKAMWPSLNAELQVETGYRQDGLILKIANEEERVFWEDWLKAAKDVEPGTRLLSPSEIGDIVRTSAPWHGAVYSPTDGRAEPTLVAPAFATAARRLGANVLTSCAVRGIETSGGRLSSVVTEHGAIRTRTAVLAGGAWSSTFMHNLHLDLPSSKQFSWCASFRTKTEGPKGNGIYNNTTWRRQIDGGYCTSLMSVTYPILPESFRNWRQSLAAAKALALGDSGWTVEPRLGRYFLDDLFAKSTWQLDEVTPFEKRRVLEPEVNKDVVNAALRENATEISDFRNLEAYDAWGGVTCMMSDMNPSLGAVASVPGLLIATSFAEGLTLAPAAGALIRDMVTGARAAINIAPFAWDRFSKS